MPFIRVEMLDGRTLDQKKEIAEVLSQNLARIVNCRVDDVQVVITEVSRENWSTGGILQSHR
ncbi:2-hydroxymuconate tautomerase [compost metagenome]